MGEVGTIDLDALGVTAVGAEVELDEAAKLLLISLVVKEEELLVEDLFNEIVEDAKLFCGVVGGG